ncbi:hypothetical protein SEA_LILMAC1015_44 [Arthrobacter phage Lilmac1015]|uniref:Uncharacterized protein n=1 Tax=Arthrobacter phage Lilmac1015 TaxID=2912653 RepID=A0AA49BRN2_9CAUD|nr:hypothetical protein SEA_LILMAC1015_44 [Arthrobacter phage Lilmac1015]
MSPEEGPRIAPAPELDSYTPGQAIEDPRAAIGKPVLAFSPSNRLMPGLVASVRPDDEREGGLLYDVAVLAISPRSPRMEPILARGLRLGDVLNPQPNTFIFQS